MVDEEKERKYEISISITTTITNSICSDDINVGYDVRESPLRIDNNIVLYRYNRLGMRICNLVF